VKIVLRQDVPKLGDAGSVQVVKNGFARNYLIPRGLAVVATAGELKVASHNQAVQDRKIEKQENLLQHLADRIDGQRLEFTARTGEHGRLYGSVTGGDIADRLSALIGEEVDRRKVVLDEAIRSIGTHTVAIHLVGKLRPRVTVVVHGEEEPTDVATNEPADDDAQTLVAEEGRGDSGHPEPGSAHDDSKTETVEQGPDVPETDGEPGASGEVEVRGGAVSETTTDGRATEV
jgi:large subunit ribosomal protein L9